MDCQKYIKNPISLWPVVSFTNSFLAIFSIWLDHKMKDLLPLVCSHIKNSSAVIIDLKSLTLPQGEKIFTANATSMYTNIETGIGITSIRNFLHINKHRIPPNFTFLLNSSCTYWKQSCKIIYSPSEKHSGCKQKEPPWGPQPHVHTPP